MEASFLMDALPQPLLQQQQQQQWQEHYTQALNNQPSTPALATAPEPPPWQPLPAQV